MRVPRCILVPFVLAAIAGCQSEDGGYHPVLEAWTDQLLAVSAARRDVHDQIYHLSEQLSLCDVDAFFALLDIATGRRDPPILLYPLPNMEEETTRSLRDLHNHAADVWANGTQSCAMMSSIEPERDYAAIDAAAQAPASVERMKAILADPETTASAVPGFLHLPPLPDIEPRLRQLAAADVPLAALALKRWRQMREKSLEPEDNR